MGLFQSLSLHMPGFYLRKKVAGSTLKIEGSIFGVRAGGRAQEGVVPPLGGGGFGAQGFVLVCYRIIIYPREASPLTVDNGSGT